MQLAQPEKVGLAMLELLHELGRPQEPVAVENLSVLELEGMHHRVAVEPVTAPAPRNELWVWRVQQVHPREVLGSAVQLGLDKVVVLVENRSEVAVELESFLLVFVSDGHVKKPLDWPEEGSHHCPAEDWGHVEGKNGQNVPL